MILDDTELTSLISLITYRGCSVMDEVLNTICSTKLTHSEYARLSKFRQFFIESLIEDMGCYNGIIRVAISEPNPYIFSGVTVYDDNLHLNQCDNKISIANLQLTFGPYDDNKKVDAEYVAKLFSEGKLIGHANMLIFYNNTIRRIEPNGSSGWDDIVDKKLSEYFKLQYPEYVYINVTPNCTGVQATTRDNFCANWSSLLSYIAVKCNEPDINKIHNMLVVRGKEYLEKLMDHWGCFMVKYLEDRRVFENHLKFDIEKLRRHTTDYYQAKKENNTERIRIKRVLITSTKQQITSTYPAKYITPEYQELLNSDIPAMSNSEYYANVVS